MRSEKGFSLMELLISLAVISVISALVVPTFLESRVAANEALAIRAVSNIVASQISYSMTVGSGNYTTDLKALQKAGLNEDLVGSGISGGYALTISGSSSEFSVQARPLVFGSSIRENNLGSETSTILGQLDLTSPSRSILLAFPFSSEMSLTTVSHRRGALWT